VTHQILETGPESVSFPIRVEVEYQGENGRISTGSLRKKVLYNRPFLLKRYPGLKEQDLDLLVEGRVQKAIQDQLNPAGGKE
jgi:hypothetical protein